MMDVTQVDSLAPPRGRLGRWVAFLRRLLRDTRAQDLIEYAVVVGLMALVAVLSLPSVSEGIHKVLMNVQAVMETAGQENCGNPNPGNFGGRGPCAPTP